MCVRLCFAMTQTKVKFQCLQQMPQVSGLRAQQKIKRTKRENAVELQKPNCKKQHAKQGTIHTYIRTSVSL